MKTKWAAELRQWRQTRKAVEDAQNFESRECDRLTELLQSEGRAGPLRQFLISDIENQLRFALADEVAGSSEVE